MMDEQIQMSRGEFYRLLASAYDHGAKSEGAPEIAKMVRGRICFDNLREGVCDHSLCFGMQELLEALIGGE
jgi:hypothetical protein